MACQARLSKNACGCVSGNFGKKQGKFQIWLALLLKNSRTAKCY
jgi:hypothetical protein